MARSRSLASLTLAAGMVAAASGAVGAADPPGRGASDRGLTEAAGKVNVQDLSTVQPLESLSLNFIRSNDPEQPGTSPGGGDPAP